MLFLILGVLLGGLIALAFAASANAAVVPVDQSTTSAGILPVQNTFVGNLPTSSLTFT